MKIVKNEKFELAFRFISETNENIFLTGKAGTGKTTFLKYLRENCSKNLIVAAPTGVAAINAGGVTLHSLFQLPFKPFLPIKIHRDELLAKIRFSKQRQSLLLKMELLIIDEISMVRCDVLDAIDTILRSIRRNYNSPFGGVQLLYIGDLHQLQPVSNTEEWNILKEFYASPFFFEAEVIKEKQPILIELDKIYRQKENSFIELLNKVRNNKMEYADFEELNKLFIPNFAPKATEKYITLTSHNRQAQEINARKLNEIKEKTYTYEASIEDDFPENNYPIEKNLLLKNGAQVMFLKNDPSLIKRYFNGKIGTISYLDNNAITVDCDGEKIEVTKETWENTRYVVNPVSGQLEQETLGTFTQFPLRLAWAITIHKSQGLTFDKVMIDAGAAFSSGQVYVALSRCTQLDGIVLLSKLNASTLFSNANVEKGQSKLKMEDSALVAHFDAARQRFVHQILTELFSFSVIEKELSTLNSVIVQQKTKLNPEALAWIEALHNGFLKERKFGINFLNTLPELLKEQVEIEKNTQAQNRIQDAVNYFMPKFSDFKQALIKQPLITEHKETSKIINAGLQASFVEIDKQIYALNHCKEGFSIENFLRNRLNYALPETKISCYAKGKSSLTGDEPNIDLYEELKNWRDETVDRENIPIYMLANQASLKEISTFLPLKKKDLMQMSGFRKAKVEKYGEEILQMVQDYCVENNLESNMKYHKKVSKDKVKVAVVDTKKTTLEAYNQGKNIAEIAKERNLTPSTIENHLTHYIEKGELPIEKFMSNEKLEKIQNAIEKSGAEGLKEILNYLGESFSYADLRMAEAHQKSLGN